MTDSELHRVLTRQLRRLKLSRDTPPDGGDWSHLLDVVSQSYAETEADRYTMERSIDVSSAEMRGLHDVLSRRAMHDELTGLPNRAALMERVQELLGAQRNGAPASAVLFIDLDGFKLVNDSLGHAAGDELLIRAAERIRSTCGPANMVGRLGGDEFIISCPQAGGVEVVCHLAARIVAELETPFRIAGRNAAVSASIGVCLSSPADETAEDVLRRADLAMYAAKTDGRGRFVLFDEAMQQAVDTRMSIKSALRTALVRDELVLHYQPVVRLRDRRIIGAEALIRWNRPGHGQVMPDDFIPIAEEGRLIGEIDAWVITQACARAAGWCRDGTDLAVNMSPRSLASADVIQMVSTALHSTGIPPHRVIIELTEASLMSGNPAAEAGLAGLRNLGIQLAIDDFGSGYASFSRLRNVPVTILKLDKSMVQSIDQHKDVAAMVGAAITMGHAMGHIVIAEGVERRSQAELLTALGCDSAQGFLFGRAEPAEVLDAALTGQSQRSPAAQPIS